MNDQRKIRPSFAAIALSVVSGLFIACLCVEYEYSDRLDPVATVGVALFALFLLVAIAQFLTDWLRRAQRLPAHNAEIPPFIRDWLLRSIFWFPVVLTIITAVLAVSIIPLIIEILMTVVSVTICVQIASHLRRIRRQSVLEYMEQATRLNLPLYRTMLAAAQGETGALRNRLNGLAAELDAGQTLASSVSWAVPELGAHVEAIAAAENAGQLPHTLARLMRKNREDASVNTMFYRQYAVIYLLIFTYIITLMAIVVLPKFHAIMADFHIPVPRITEFAEQIVLPIFEIGSAVMILGWLTWWSARPLIPAILRSSTGRAIATNSQIFISHIPFVGAVIQDRGMADACDFLSEALDSGRPLNVALNEAGAASRSALLISRMREWSAGISNGLSLVDAGRNAGIPRLVIGMLPATQDGPALAMVFRYLARYYEMRWDRAKALAQSVATPAIVFVMGALAALVALSLFQPLANLDQSALRFPGGF